MTSPNTGTPATPPKPKTPAVMWTAVLALIPLLIEWLQGEHFAGEDWVLLAVALLTMTARFIEVYVAQLKAQESANAEPPQMMGMAGTASRSPAPPPSPVAVSWKRVVVEAIFG